jgi:hypothetical protein
LGGDEHRAQDERTVEQRIEGLAAEIAGLIESGSAESRRDLCDLAVGLVRERTAGVEIPPPAQGTASAAPFNPIAFSIPLLLVGFVLVGIFPPVGLLILLFALVTLAWGLVAALLFR